MASCAAVANRRTVLRETKISAVFIAPELHVEYNNPAPQVEDSHMEDRKLNVGRREFAKMAAGAAAVLSSTRSSRATVHPNPPGIKIATSAPANPTDEDLLFFQQAGVEYVSLPANPQSNAESFTKMRERYESAGIKVYNIGSGVGPSGSLHNMPEVTLNLPGRDQKIEEYKQYLRYLGQAGIHYTTYAHMGNGIWNSGRETIRGASGRA